MSLPTVLVDNSGRITRYDPVHPFFYRVRAAGNLAFIGSAGGGGFAGRTRGEDVLRTLEQQGWYGRSWQLFVLCPLRESGGSANTLVAAGGMSDKLYQLKEDILGYLSALHQEPIRTVVIFYDTVPRNGATAEPFMAPEKRRFQIDTFGFVREQGNFSPLFSNADFQELDKVWSSPFDMGGCPTDRGLAGLSDEKKQELGQLCVKAKEIVQECVRQKQKALAKYSDQSSSLFLSDHLLQKVQQKFSSELDGMLTRQNISGFSSYMPAGHLKTIVREIYSVVGVTRHDAISVFRFPLSITESELPLQVLSLAYLLLAFLEQGDDLQLPTGSILQARVLLDNDSLQTEFAHILARWEDAQKQLQKAPGSNRVAKLELIQGCRREDESRPLTSLPEASIPPFASSEKWKTICENTSREFNKFRDENSAWLSKLYKRLARAQSENTRDIDDPRDFIRSLEKKEQACQQQLLDKPYGDLAGPVKQWRKEIDRLGLLVELFFREKPSFQTRLILPACSFLLLAAPPLSLYLAENPLPSIRDLTPGQYVFLAGLALASMLPLLFLYLADRRRLKKLRSKAEGLVRQTAHELGKILEHNIEFLFNLCQLFVLRNNRAKVRSWLKDDETGRKCHRFFIDRLSEHFKLWSDVYKVTPGTGGAGLDVDKPELARPPEQQPLFFVGGEGRSSYRYQIDNLGARVDATSPDMPGIEQIIIRRDGASGVRS